MASSNKGLQSNTAGRCARTRTCPASSQRGPRTPCTQRRMLRTTLHHVTLSHCVSQQLPPRAGSRHTHTHTHTHTTDGERETARPRCSATFGVVLELIVAVVVCGCLPFWVSHEEAHLRERLARASGSRASSRRGRCIGARPHRRSAGAQRRVADLGVIDRRRRSRQLREHQLVQRCRRVPTVAFAPSYGPGSTSRAPSMPAATPCSPPFSAINFARAHLCASQIAPTPDAGRQTGRAPGGVMRHRELDLVAATPRVRRVEQLPARSTEPHAALDRARAGVCSPGPRDARGRQADFFPFWWTPRAGRRAARSAAARVELPFLPGSSRRALSRRAFFVAGADDFDEPADLHLRSLGVFMHAGPWRSRIFTPSPSSTSRARVALASSTSFRSRADRAVAPRSRPLPPPCGSISEDIAREDEGTVLPSGRSSPSARWGLGAAGSGQEKPRGTGDREPAQPRRARLSTDLGSAGSRPRPRVLLTSLSERLP